MCVGLLLKPGMGQSVIATGYPVPSRLLIHRTVHTCYFFGGEGDNYVH